MMRLSRGEQASGQQGPVESPVPNRTYFAVAHTPYDVYIIDRSIVPPSAQAQQRSRAKVPQAEICTLLFSGAFDDTMIGRRHGLGNDDPCHGLHVQCTCRIWPRGPRGL